MCPLGTVAELLVTDVQRLVNDEGSLLNRGCDGELHALGHTRRIGPHRQVDEVFETGELDDVVELLLDLGARCPKFIRRL